MHVIMANNNIISRGISDIIIFNDKPPDPDKHINNKASYEKHTNNNATPSILNMD